MQRSIKIKQQNTHMICISLPSAPSVWCDQNRLCLVSWGRKRKNTSELMFQSWKVLFPPSDNIDVLPRFRHIYWWYNSDKYSGFNNSFRLDWGQSAVLCTRTMSFDVVKIINNIHSQAKPVKTLRCYKCAHSYKTCPNRFASINNWNKTSYLFQELQCQNLQ